MTTMGGKSVSEEMLEVFSLEEILEMNDLTHEEALSFLVESGLIEIPAYLEPIPELENGEEPYS